MNTGDLVRYKGDWATSPKIGIVLAIKTKEYRGQPISSRNYLKTKYIVVLVEGDIVEWPEDYLEMINEQKRKN